jgi:hypothetical protein
MGRGVVRTIWHLDRMAESTILIPEIEMYEALVEAGVSKDKARDVVLAQKEAMDQVLTTLATKIDLTEFRTHVDGRFNLVAEQVASTKTDLTEFRTYVDGRFNLVAEQIASTKTDLTEFRTYVDGRFNLVAAKTELAELRTYVDGRFNLVGEQMTSMTNKIVIRLGTLMVVLTGLLGTLLALMHH